MLEIKIMKKLKLIMVSIAKNYKKPPQKTNELKTQTNQSNKQTHTHTKPPNTKNNQLKTNSKI